VNGLMPQGRMDGFGLIANRRSQVAVHPVGKEGSHGSRQLRDDHQAFEEGLVSRQFILTIIIGSRFPEAAASQAYIPVAEVFVYKAFNGATGFGGLVVIHSLAVIGHQVVQF